MKINDTLDIYFNRRYHWKRKKIDSYPNMIDSSQNEKAQQVCNLLKQYRNLFNFYMYISILKLT